MVVQTMLFLAAVDCTYGRAAVTSYTIVPLCSDLAAPLQKINMPRLYRVDGFYMSSTGDPNHIIHLFYFQNESINNT